MNNRMLILFLILILAKAATFADMWTNAAGHGIEATLVSLEKDTVTLRRDKGKPFRMKLSSLCSADQKRIRKHFGMNAVPRKPTAADLAYEKQLARLRQLQAAGKMDDEEFRKQRSILLEHFYPTEPR